MQQVIIHLFDHGRNELAYSKTDTCGRFKTGKILIGPKHSQPQLDQLATITCCHSMIYQPCLKTVSYIVTQVGSGLRDQIYVQPQLSKKYYRMWSHTMRLHQVTQITLIFKTGPFLGALDQFWQPNLIWEPNLVCPDQI